MKLKLLGAPRSLVALAASLFASLAQADCNAPANAGACPIKAGNTVVFDRCFGSLNGQPTDFGNLACNGLRDTHKLIDAVGDNNRAAVARAEADWKALVKVTLDGAIDRDAIKQFQSVAGVGKEIESDINALLKDPQCGSKASMDAIARRMKETGDLIIAGGQVAGLGLEAVGKLQPVVAEAAKIIAELQRVADAVNKKGAKAKTEYDALNRAITDLQKEMATLLATDFAGVASAGLGLATGVGPFVGECTGCATAIGAAIASLSGGGAAAAGGGVACPETGVACAVPVVSLPVGAGGAAVMGAISTGPCLAAAAGMDKMGEHVSNINRFVDGLVKLANAIPRSATQAVNAGQALARLATEMGSEGQQSLRNIQASINAMQPAFDAAATILEDRIAPKVQRMAGNFVQDLGRDTALLSRCYAKLVTASAHIGEDLAEAAGLMVQAAGDLVDAGKVVNNLSDQGNDALRTSTKFATDEWKDIDHDFRKLSARMWGVPFGTVDVPKTGAHVAALLTNQAEVRDIVGDSGRLLDRIAKLPADSLNAGKRAFLDQDRFTIQAKGKYDAGQAKVKKAAIAMTKAKASAKAKIAAAPKMATPATPTALAAWPAGKAPRLVALNAVK